MLKTNKKKLSKVQNLRKGAGRENVCFFYSETTFEILTRIVVKGYQIKK